MRTHIWVGFLLFLFVSILFIHHILPGGTLRLRLLSSLRWYSLLLLLHNPLPSTLLYIKITDMYRSLLFLPSCTSRLTPTLPQTLTFYSPPEPPALFPTDLDDNND